MVDIIDFGTHTLANSLAKKKGFLGKVVRGYRSYKRLEPKFDKAKIEKLGRKAKMEKLRTKIAKSRATRAKIYSVNLKRLNKNE